MYRALIFLLPIVAILTTVNQVNAKGRSCLIADITDTSLNVRDEPNGEVINRLRNGRLVNITRTKNDIKGRPWGYAIGTYKGKSRKWGWVFMHALDCSAESKEQLQQGNQSTQEYPIFMDGGKDLKLFGFHIGNFDRPENIVDAFDRECFYYGDGGYDLSLSTNTISHFKSRGFTFVQMCAGLRVENLKFNPETGQKIPTYLIGNSVKVEAYAKSGDYPESGVVSEELPLDLPRCMQASKIKKEQGYVSIKTKCDFKFDPNSGEKLSANQRNEFNLTNIDFVLDGAAGPSADIISKKLLLASKKRKTKAQVTAVLNARSQ